ncbi:MAG: PrsW family glutamic-type intramembrane protease, partial [Deltaproteobacteria bacterium]|nr:PrsW family glutamic-type intramembrane protease [Deltaproteobacteria bacterium]
MIIALLFSLLVALFWLGKFRKMDKFEKEPERLIYLAFFAGALSTIPSVLLEIPFKTANSHHPPLLSDLFLLFLWVGIVEETFKFLAVRLTVYRSSQFNEVMDGMIYMVSAAMGFAATENVGYMLGFGFSVGFFRAILSYLAHLSFSAVLGYYMGKAKIEKNQNWLWIGFILAVSLHWF